MRELPLVIATLATLATPATLAALAALAPPRAWAAPAVLAAGTPLPGGAEARPVPGGSASPGARAPGGAVPDGLAAGLSPAQREVLEKVVEEEFCYCGCPHTLGGCLREHPSCKHAPRMAALAARLAGAGLTRNEILRLLTQYYAGFDQKKRVALDERGFGPPLGKAEAAVTIVEFSDFTCPYCQLLRPELERFVADREGRVKLVYKPFPLPSHAHAMEAAQAAEWARDKGLFWKMHDHLFAHPHALAEDDLVAHANRLGADGEDLRRALAEGRHKARVQASQAEARAGGLVGTPTLFFNGRRHVLPDLSAATLQFTLEDEEEWQKHGGWSRD